jgi:hypothetical protein
MTWDTFQMRVCRTCNYLSAAKGGLDTPNTPPKKKVRGALQLVVVAADETVGGKARESDSRPIRSR